MGIKQLILNRRNYEKGYMDGHKDGYNAGIDEGWETGHNDKFGDGQYGSKKN